MDTVNHLPVATSGQTVVTSGQDHPMILFFFFFWDIFGNPRDIWILDLGVWEVTGLVLCMFWRCPISEFRYGLFKMVKKCKHECGRNSAKDRNECHTCRARIKRERDQCKKLELEQRLLDMEQKLLRMEIDCRNFQRENDVLSRLYRELVDLHLKSCSTKANPGSPASAHLPSPASTHTPIPIPVLAPVTAPVLCSECKKRKWSGKGRHPKDPCTCVL